MHGGRTEVMRNPAEITPRSRRGHAEIRSPRGVLHLVAQPDSPRGDDVLLRGGDALRLARRGVLSARSPCAPWALRLSRARSWGGRYALYAPSGERKEKRVAALEKYLGKLVEQDCKKQFKKSRWHPDE